jgi:hypothetical protein
MYHYQKVFVGWIFIVLLSFMSLCSKLSSVSFLYLAVTTC